MLNIRIYILISFFLLIGINAVKAENHIISSTTTVVEGIINGNIVNPGDTIKLLSGQRNYILFRNITGSSINPIVIINSGGQVDIRTSHFYAIKFQTCRYIKISGNGHSSYNYGILISNNTHAHGTGLSIDNLSSDVEVEYMEISNIPTAGIYAKTDPYFKDDCTVPASRANFTMYNVSIHDCYLHDITDEGMYIGSSKYMGQTISNSTCGSLEVLPHVIEGVQIYNNTVENTGWDGIQVSSATKDCAIYSNIIRNDSYRGTTNQMSGILIGGGSNCDCYNNKIFDGKGDGIDILGLGNHNIYNNLIVRAGKSFKPEGGATSNPKHGIWVGHVSTDSDSEMRIYNNTIIDPKTHGMKITNVSINSYKIYNNIISQPGSYSILGENSYFNISLLANHQKSNNYLTNNESEIQFINTTNENYDLEALSPAVNEGLDVSGFNLTFDIENKSRPFGDAYDIGAYESHESGIGIEDDDNYINKKVILNKVVPNPVLSSSKISYELKDSMTIKLFIMTVEGKIVDVLVNQKQQPSKYTIDIHKNMLASGCYFLILESNFGKLSEKFVIL
jgi:hypothetical protein